MTKLLVINGPNLQLLGIREIGVYGKFTLEQIESVLKKKAASYKKLNVDFFQSNSEGEIIDKIALALTQNYDGIIINPAAYTHTSVAIYDALKAVNLPAIEVHISNIYEREEFRTRSITASACIGLISGFGMKSYEYALTALMDYLSN